MQVKGATLTWNQTAANTYSWITPTNWTPTGFPNGIGDIANLNNAIAGAQTINLDQVITLGTLNIGDTTTTNAFTLAAGTSGYLMLDAASGSTQINKTGNALDVISTGLQFNDTLAITNNTASGTLTLSGALRSLASDISFNGTGAVATGSIVVSGAISTAGNLVKNDAGISSLGAANTYAGSTTINGGRLLLTNATALPIRTAVTVAAGAFMDFPAVSLTIGSLSGTGTVTATAASATRTLTIGRDDTSTTFNGQFLGPSTKTRLAITKVGAGTLTLAPLSGSSATAAGDYTGATVINGGALRLDFSQGTFTGTSMLATSPVTIAGGNLQVKGRNSGSAIAQTVGALTLGAGGGSIIMDANGSGLGTQLTFNAATVSTAAGGSLLINSPANTSVRLGSAMNTATTINGRIVYSGDSGATYDWAANTGATTNTASLSSYTDVAGTIIANGTSDTNNSRIDSTTASQVTTLSGTWVTNSLKINSGGAGTGQSLSIGTSLTLTNGGLLVTGANAYTVGGAGSLTNAADLVIHQYNSGGLTVNAPIAGVALTKAGTGPLTLGGLNTFTGGIFVNSGVLSFSQTTNIAGGLGAGVAQVIRLGDGATLRYTGNTGTIAAATSPGSYTFVLNGGNSNIDVSTTGQVLTLSGVISGAGGYTKTGLGTLEIGASSTFTGPLFINQGTVRPNGNFNISSSSSPVTVAAAGTLDINGTAASLTTTIGSLSGAGTVTNSGGSAKTLSLGGDNTSTTFSGLFAGAAGNVMTKIGSGVFTLSGAGAASAWTGGTNVSGGVLRLASNNRLSTTGTMVIANANAAAQLELNAGVAQTLAAITIYGTGSSATSQGSILIGSGATLTTSGTVTVNNSNNPLAASIDGAGNLAMTAARTFDIRDSTTVPSNEAELVINTTMSGAAGGITKAGGGNLKITGTNTMTGTTANTFNSGITWLDYTTNNTDKINDTGALAFGGGTVILTGNNSAATTQAVAGLTLSSGSGVLTLNPGAGQTLALNLGAITRATSGGGMRFNLPTGTVSSSNGFVTSQANVNGILGGYATATDGSSTGFATNSGGNIAVLSSTAKDDVTTWSAGEDITDSSGFTGTVGSSMSINTLRFNAAGPSTVTIGNGNTLKVTTGGILQTASVTGGTSLITGGTLSSDASNELILTVDSATQRLEVASAINGATAITKLGDGTLRLSGANTATGVVNLYSGTLQVSGSNAFGDTAALVISANKSSVFEVLASETVGSLSGGQNQASLASEIKLSTGTALTINQSVNATYSGAITGSGTLVKTGSGTLAINSAATTSLVSGSSFAGTVIINQGILEFNGSTGSLSGATSWTINGAGALYSNKDNTTQADAIGNTVGITLNNTNQAGAVFNTEGLVHRTNQGNTKAETMASITLGAGHNTITAFGNATNAIADLVIGTSAGISRTGRATALVRGNALGASSGTRGQIRVSDATGNTALDNAEVGGAGAAASTNISIIPWLVGDLSQTALGNTFVTNVNATNGLRPLASTEFISDSTSITGTLTDNIRFTASAAISATPVAINSLVLDSTSAIALTGSASGMEITSGALLSAGAAGHSINGITSLTTGAGRDYTVYVTDPAGSLTLNSALTSLVPLVKSGAGALILASASNAFTDLYVNQGVVRADAASKLGGSGALNFAGGTLRFDAAFDPTATKSINFGTGGGTLNTNGNNITLANGLGSGTGALTKIGAGSLTLGGTGATYSGGTTIAEGRLTASNTAGSATGSGVLTINGGTSAQASLGGTGFITGGVTLATNGATSFAQGPSINPGAIGGAGTLTINTAALTTNDFSGLFFDLDTLQTVGGGVNDLISTNIIPVFNGSTQLNINTLGTLTGGFYTLINGYTGTIGTFDNVSLNTTFTGVDTARSGFLVNEANQLRIFVTGATPTSAYWSGANDANWNNFNTSGSPSTNWRTDATGNVDTLALPGSTTDIFFQTTTPIAGNLSTTLGQAFSVKTLNFTADATSPVFISGSSLSLTPGSSSTGISINAAAGAVTINSDVVLGASQTWTNNAVNTFTVNGEVSGVASLTKAGTGKLVLTGTNTYVGNTTLSAGTLVAASAQALGLAANTLTLNGGILDLVSNTSTTAKNTTVGGNVTINSNLASAGTGITHTLGTLTIGAQTLSLTKGANVSSGTAGLSFGATDIGTGGVVFDAATGTALTITGIINGGPGNSTQASPGLNTAITVKGGGTVSFSNSGNTFTGDILVDGGTFVVDNLRDWGMTNTISVDSHTVILSNAGKLNVTASLNPGAATTTTYNLVQIGTGGGTIDTASGAILTLDDAGQLYGSGDLTKTGVGTLSLRNQGTFGGQIIVSAGTLQPTGGTGSNLGTVGVGTTIQSGAAFNLNGISIAEAEPLTISGTGLASLPVGVITNNSSTGATFLGPITLAAHSTVGSTAAGGITLSGGITGPFDFTVNNSAAGGVTLSTTSINNTGSISNISTGTGGIAMNAVVGSNVTSIIQNSLTSGITLSANNSTFSGPILIKAGTLSASLTGVATTMGDGSATNSVTIGDSSGSNNATLNGVNALTYAQNIIIASGNTGVARINAGTTTGSVIFAGTITLNSHDVVLGKIGTTGTSQFTGGITGTGNVTLLNEATTGTITLATGAVNPVGSITHTSTATGATTISAAIGSNVTGIAQNTATSSLTLSNASIAFTGPLTVSAGTLNFTGGFTTGPTVTGLTVAAGGSLQLNNTVGQHFNLGAGALSLGAGTGTATLLLELGSLSNYDRITTSIAATAANSVGLNLLGIAGFQAGNYDLISAGSGLSGATYSINSVSGAVGGFTLGLTSSDTLVQLTATANNGTYYWNGGLSPNTSWAGISGGNTNWTNDLAGTTNANGVPGLANSVVFSTSAQTGTALTTSVDGPFSVRDLTFNNQVGSGPLASITLNPGVAGTLTLTPAAPTAGIDVQTGAPAAISFAAPIVLGTAQTWTVADAATVLSSSGGISGTSLGLTKAGAGILQLNGTNTYSGTTTIGGGILRAGGTNGFAQNSAHVVNSGATLRLNGLANTVASLAGAGIVENASATAVTLSIGGNATTTFSGTFQDGAGGGALSLSKGGTGKLTLSGTNTYTGTTAIPAGILEITSPIATSNQVNVGSGAGGRGIFLIGANASVSDIDVGTNTSAGAAYQTGGTVSLSAADANGGFGIGNANSSFGYYEISGGTLSSNRLTLGNTATSGSGVFRQTGGTVTINTNVLPSHGSGSSLTDISGGQFNGPASNFGMNSAAGSNNSYAVFNLRGTGTLVLQTALNVYRGSAATIGSTSIFNLGSGGTIRTAAGGISNGTTTGASGNLMQINLNGGTIITNVASTTLINVLNTNNVLDVAANRSGAYVYSGGVTIDTNALNSTIPAALLAPTGEGVSTIAVASGGSGYLSAPIIRIAGGTGSGATAIANMVDDGSGNGTYSIGSITITNPGTGYVNSDSLALSFIDNTTLYTTQATLGAVTFNGGNTSGGLTKVGPGTLTLTGASTYTGGTTINAGTLASGVANSLADTGAVTINGGTFDVATFNDTVGIVTLQSGTLTGSTGVLSSASNFALQSGTVNFTGAGGLGGAGNVVKTTAGSVTFTNNGLGAFANNVGFNGGVLSFATSAQLGNASATNTLSGNGGTLQYTGSGSLDLGANRVLTVNSGGATLDVTQSTGVLTLSGGVANTSTGNLTKSGPGSLVISNTANLNGGTVTVSDGKLSASFGTSGISALTVGATGNMSFQNGAATALSLSGAIDITSGARLGFDLGTAGGPGASDQLNSMVAAIVSGTITLDFINITGFGTGSYNLISAASGLSNASYVLGTGISGYKLVPVVTDTLVSLNVTPFTPIYWRGGQNASWNTLGAATANWTTDAAGTLDSGHTPLSTETVVFSANGTPFTSGTQINTTLDFAFTIDSLQFTSTPATVSGVIIAAGTGGSLSLSPTSTVDGIEVQNNAGTVTLSAPLTVGSNQTWSSTGSNSALVISGPTTFTGNVTKTGSGAVTLSGGNSGAGSFSLMVGTLNLNHANALGTGTLTLSAGTTLNNTSAGAITLATNNAQTWTGSYTFTGTQALNLGTGAVTLANNAIITTSASTLTVGGAIGQSGGNRSLTKAGAGTLTLSGNNTFAGGLTLNAGNLNLGNTGALGTGTFTINGGTLDNTSGGTLTNANNNAQAWNSSFIFTGSSSLNLGNGGVALGTTPTVTVSNNTLTVGGVISGAFGLSKDGTGTLALNAASTYTGATTITTGTVTTGVDNALPITTALTIGSGTTTAALDLGSNSQTVASFTATANNAGISNVTIGSGDSLTVNGNFSLNNNTNNAVTNVTMAGGGALIVNGASFTVGNNTTGTNNASQASLNLAALSNFNATVSGTFAVQLQGDNNAKASSLVLSNTANTVTATTFGVGISSSSGTHSLTLGAGTNVINANTVNIGTGARDAGSFTFGGNATGSVTIRNTAGSGRAAMNIGTGTATTGATATNTVNLAGHNANLLLSTLVLGNQFRNGAQTNTFTFDTGVLDATTVQVGFLPAAGGTQSAVTHTSTMNLNGGTVTIGSGGLELGNSIAANTSVAKTVNAVVNVAGANVTIANNSTLGAAVRLLNNSGASNVNNVSGTLNISSGSVTVAGDIIRGTATTGTGTNSAILTLDGGTLNMSARNIGASGSLVTFNARSGTLQNVAEINGGAGLTKSAGAGTNTLILEGTNAYTGGTTISSGVLQVGTGSTTGTLGSGAITNNATLTFNRSNSYTMNENISGGGNVIQAGSGTTVLGGNNSYAGGTQFNAGTLQVNSSNAIGTTGTLSFSGGTLQYSANNTTDYSARISTAANQAVRIDTNGQSVSFATALSSSGGSLTKLGTGTFTLTGANSYTGTTTVSAGTLLLNANNSAATGDVGVTGATLGGNGIIGGAVSINAGGVLAAGSAAATAGTLTLADDLILAGSGTPQTRLVFDFTNATGNVGAGVLAVGAAWWSSYSGALLTGNGSQNNDLINLTASSASSLTWNTGGKVSLNQLGSSYTWMLGDVLNLLDWTSTYNGGGTITGTFNPATDFDLPALSGGLTFDTTRFLSTGAIAVTPEPSRALLLMLGLLGLSFRRRRQ